MRKNLIEPATARETIARIEKLTSQAEGKWGRMDATEMLHHCTLALHATLQGTSDSRPSSPKQLVLRWLFLHVIPRFPKGAKAPKRFDIKLNSIQTETFEKEQKDLIAVVTKFRVHNKPIEAHHPVFGKLTSKQWGILTWMHLDHHLRQFGV